jgi:hypothetical protein
MRWLLLRLSLFVCFTAFPCAAQLMTSLQPRTIEEFEAYAHRLENVLQQRWDGKQPFLSLDENPSERAKVLHGEMWIQPGNPRNPLPIENGLVHDWVGAVFVPHTDIQNTLDILKNFDRHSQIYPEVEQSRIIARDGNDITGFWRLQRKQSLVTVVLEVTQDAHWRQVGPGKWACRAYAKNISEIEHAGTPQEQRLPVGQGSGYLWRLYAYWTLETTNGGVLGECRSLSLSRDIPGAIAWIIKPFVQSLPRDTLAGTLRNTRAAAEK